MGIEIVGMVEVATMMVDGEEGVVDSVEAEAEDSEVEEEEVVVDIEVDGNWTTTKGNALLERRDWLELGRRLRQQLGLKTPADDFYLSHDEGSGCSTIPFELGRRIEI